MDGLRAFLNGLSGYSMMLILLVWFVAAAWFAIRLPDEGSESRGRKPSASRNLRRPLRKVWHFFRTFAPELWIIPPSIVFFGALAFVPKSFWHALTWWNPVPAVLGTALILFGTVLMLWARWVLGSMWAGRPMVQQSHELRTSGPYRLVRHPIYTGLLCLAFGAPLVFGFGYPLSYPVFLVPFVAVRVLREERMMTETFGDAYRTYRLRVPALIPFLRGLPPRGGATGSQPAR